MKNLFNKIQKLKEYQATPWTRDEVDGMHKVKRFALESEALPAVIALVAIVAFVLYT